MKRILSIVITMVMLIVFGFTSIAFAAGGIEDIHAASNITELENAIRETGDLSEEVSKMDELSKWEKNNLLTELMSRKKYQEDIAAFKELFEKELTDATTYMSFAEGYPYVTGESVNGAYLVVKTDMDGWVYIVSVPESAEGGLTTEYEIVKYYDTNDIVYKDKVFVKGGVETKIPVSSSDWGSGGEYRIYFCLEVNNNLSEFMQINYFSEFVYSNAFARSIFDLFPIPREGIFRIIDLYLMGFQADILADVNIEFINNDGIYIRDVDKSYPYLEYNPDNKVGDPQYIALTLVGPNRVQTAIYTITFENGVTRNATLKLHGQDIPFLIR